MVVAKAVVAGEARRGRVPGVRRAPSVPMESGNEEMKLPLTFEIQARAMAHALLREVHVWAEDPPARSDELSQGATQAARKRGLWARSKAVADT